MASRCLRPLRQAARAACTGATAAANTSLDLIFVFAAIIWRQDYRPSQISVTHSCRSNTVNRTVRGWYGYFQHSRSSTFRAVDGYVRRRLRSLLEKRRGRTRQGLGRAHNRWPNEWFARRGLLSLAAEHEWTRTTAAMRTH